MRKKSLLVFDTSFNERIVTFVKNLISIICESTFGEESKRKQKIQTFECLKKLLRLRKNLFKKINSYYISQR